ncbi:MAG: Gfo/Idh/MocA family oxidoreductase [Chloroflexi bacterium]|nr:Gfo/Idh/MocA family oxidoreductase [Chloroflexota bacterium]
MSQREQLHIGVVGAGGRGGSLAAALGLLPDLRVRAVCDANADALPEAAQRYGAAEASDDYAEMLSRSDLDAVVIATPMPLHAPQAIAALRLDLHVLSEVPAAVSLDECRALVHACAHSRGLYMLAENCNYTRANLMISELVRKGLFGVPYYAEGEYLHELRQLNEITRWRRRWQTGVNGITYPTHSLGPILQWLPGDRVVSLCCAGSGRHYRDTRGKLYENETSCVMLCKLRSGGLVKIRVDMLSDRPHLVNRYQLQGTDGAYESASAPGEPDRIWLRALCPDKSRWFNLQELEAEYLPALWREQGELAQRSGHGGGDLLALSAFVEAIRLGRPSAIDIHAALDMTLPGLVSQQSIAAGGRWLPVPDSRTWEETI